MTLSEEEFAHVAITAHAAAEETLKERWKEMEQDKNKKDRYKGRR